MENVKFVCVSCHKIDNGDGIWTAPPDGHSVVEQTNCLCKNCARQRFPQFYSDLNNHENQKKFTSGLAIVLKKIFTRYFYQH